MRTAMGSAAKRNSIMPGSPGVEESLKIVLLEALRTG
jgi:hypothetical protein